MSGLSDKSLNPKEGILLKVLISLRRIYRRERTQEGRKEREGGRERDL